MVVGSVWKYIPADHSLEFLSSLQTPTLKITPGKIITNDYGTCTFIDDSIKFIKLSDIRCDNNGDYAKIRFRMGSENSGVQNNIEFRNLRFKIDNGRYRYTWSDQFLDIHGKHLNGTGIYEIVDEWIDTTSEISILSNYENGNNKPELNFAEFVNTEFYSNWRLLHVHHDQSLRKSDYMTDNTKNYFRLPNSLSEIEFGYGSHYDLQKIQDVYLSTNDVIYQNRPFKVAIVCEFNVLTNLKTENLSKIELNYDSTKTTMTYTISGNIISAESTEKH